jgi:general secretion pathway protein F
MTNHSLQRIDGFNQDLIALAATGVPIDLGDLGGQSVADKLGLISSELRSRVQSGQTVEQAVNEASDLPASYRAAIRTWLRCDNPAIAFDALTAPAIAQQQLRRNLGQAMVYPLILLTLAYFGFIYACQVTSPRMEAIYSQLSLAPTPSLLFLNTSRQLLPVWGPLVPLLILLFAGWFYWRGTGWRWTWLPGSQKYYESIRNADFALHVSRLLNSGVSPEESLSLALPMLGNQDGSVARLPSLLRWALSEDLGGEPRASVLAMVANTYRKAAERQSTIWRVAVPTVCGVLLGGVLVFGYGLSLFYPLVSLLKDISMPGGA